MTTATANGRTAASTDWGFALYEPTEARPSEAHPEWGPQHSLKVQRGDDELRVWFKPGILSYIQQGDALLLQYRNGRWKLAYNQPPEILSELQKRYLQSRPDLQAPPRAKTQPSPQHKPVPTEQLPEMRSHELQQLADEMLELFGYLRRRLPNEEPRMVQALASTVWIQHQQRKLAF